MKLRLGLRLLVIVVAGLFIAGLVRNVLRLWRSGDRLGQAEEKLESLRAENLRLKQQQQFLGSDVFFEQQIRDKLNMAKPGEAVVLLPPVASLQPTERESTEETLIETPVWQQWLVLFW